MGLDEASGESGPARPSDEKSGPRRLRSSDLFRDGARRVVISHEGREYVLIITKSGKLLLNLVD